MIKKVTSLYYNGTDNGIILDDAYDLYKRNQYIKYIKEKSINYLYCQDLDMNLLASFPDMEFITIPEDAENIEGVYNLKLLTGLEITANKLKLLDLSYFSNLEYLVIHDYSSKQNLLINCKQLKYLCIVHSDITSLKSILINYNLESLRLDFCYNLKTLNGIESLKHLNKMELDYCLRLENILDIQFTANSLKEFIITDCNKIQELSTILGKLSELETLYISTFQTNSVNKLPSIEFIKNLTKLKNFMTDYKIEDGNLKPLLNIENVDILKFYKHYNLQKDSFAYRGSNCYMLGIDL